MDYETYEKELEKTQEESYDIGHDEGESDAHNTILYWIQSDDRLYDFLEINKFNKYIIKDEVVSTFWRTLAKALGREDELKKQK